MKTKFFRTSVLNLALVISALNISGFNQAVVAPTIDLSGLNGLKISVKGKNYYIIDPERQSEVDLDIITSLKVQIPSKDYPPRWQYKLLGITEMHVPVNDVPHQLGTLQLGNFEKEISGVSWKTFLAESRGAFFYLSGDVPGYNASIQASFDPMDWPTTISPDTDVFDVLNNTNFKLVDCTLDSGVPDVSFVCKGEILQ